MPTHTGYHAAAPNGFMNGMGDELEQNEDDAYPEDGPLHSGTHSLRRIPASKSPMVRCPHFRGCYVQALMELEPEGVSLLERCPHFRGCYICTGFNGVGPEDVSLLERWPHFRGCYVQASMELGPEDLSLLERCPHFRGCHVQASMELDLKMCPY